MKRSIYIALMCATVMACKKDKVEPVDLGYDYFPVEIGRYVVYNVDSIYIDEPVDIADTFHYQIKEVITEHFTDNEGNPAQRIERFYRADSSQSWVIKDVWAANRLTRNAQRVEENKRIIRMVFPPGDDKFWDANEFNTSTYRPMRYADYDRDRIVNGMQFDSTLKTVTTLEPNLIDTIIDTEIRAKHVGVVHKLHIETNTQIDGTTGFKLTMRVVDYGVE